MSLLDNRSGHGRVLVTRAIPYGDDDVVARLFSEEHGRVGAFARKARSSKRRFPSLAPPALGQASWTRRARGDLVELTGFDADPLVLGLSADLRRLGHASYLVELVERLLPEAAPAPEVFRWAADALRTLSTSGASAALLRAFELKLLRALGYLPDLVVDGGGACQSYDALRGVFSSTAPGASGQAGQPFSQGALEAARALALPDELLPLPDVDESTLRAVGRIFAAHLRQQLTEPLASVQFLAAVDRLS